MLHDIHDLLMVLASHAGVKVAYKVDNVPFYKHTEEFRLGQSVSMSRRDKKSGQQHATMRAVPKGVEVDIQLDPPFSGGYELSLHASLCLSAMASLHDAAIRHGINTHARSCALRAPAMTPTWWLKLSSFAPALPLELS